MGKTSESFFPIVTNSLTYHSALYYRQGGYDVAWVCWLFCPRNCETMFLLFGCSIPVILAQSLTRSWVMLSSSMFDKMCNIWSNGKRVRCWFDLLSASDYTPCLKNAPHSLAITSTDINRFLARDMFAFWILIANAILKSYLLLYTRSIKEA